MVKLLSSAIILPCSLQRNFVFFCCFLFLLFGLFPYYYFFFSSEHPNRLLFVHFSHNEFFIQNTHLILIIFIYMYNQNYNILITAVTPYSNTNMPNKVQFYPILSRVWCCCRVLYIVRCEQPILFFLLNGFLSLLDIYQFRWDFYVPNTRMK